MSRWKYISLMTLLLATIGFFSWRWFVSPLPSDEYMIMHLKEHKADYDELIFGYIDAKQRGNDAMKGWLSSFKKTEMQHRIKAKDEMVKSEDSQWYGGIEIHSPDKFTVKSIEFHLEGATNISMREGSIIWKTYEYFPEDQMLTEGKSLCPVGTGKKCLGEMNIEVLPSLNGFPLFSGASGDRDRRCGSYARKLDDHWFLVSSKACL